MHGALGSARAKQLLPTGGAGPGGAYGGGSTLVAGGRTQSWRDFSMSAAVAPAPARGGWGAGPPGGLPGAALSSVRAASQGSHSFSRASVGRPGVLAAAGGSGSASGWAAVLQVRTPPRPGAPRHPFRAHKMLQPPWTFG